MLRSVRTLKTGLGPARLSAGCSLVQVQTRQSSHLVKRSLSRSPKRKSNSISIDDTFKNDIVRGGNKNGRLGRNQTKYSGTAQEQSNPGLRVLGFQKRQHVSYSKDHILSIFEPPTASQYGISFDPIAQCSKLIQEAELFLTRKYEPLQGTSKRRCLMALKFGDNRALKVEGHGVSNQDAREAADLHAICQLHKLGYLREILPGGEHHKYVGPSKSKLRQEIDAKRDILDFGARHDCLPVFSFHKMATAKKLIRAHASIPALGLDGYGRAKSTTDALLAACISLKSAAEARHEEIGGGTLLVKDYTKLTTASSEKFVRFYCRQQQLDCASSTVEANTNKTGGQWISTITLRRPLKNSDQGDLFMFKEPSKPLFDSDAWPGREPSDAEIKENHERSFEGVPMISRDDSEAVGYLATAVTLKRESTKLWNTFVKEMKRGNGDILKSLSPIDIGVDSGVVEIMESTLQNVAVAERQEKFDSKQFEEETKRRASSLRQLSESDIERKNQILQSRLSHYETHSALEELRRKRSELPMVQHRDQVMTMISANDVCVVVGATGSGKTTQVPQLILDELTRAGQGASCNIICTQPRRIAAVSVAQRVAVERDEALRNSVGYSVRFDSKPPQFGGSIHYCTTGILLKQMQDNQDAMLDGISHIIIDEVHERDLNNDFLLVILKKLLADRKAAGKPPIKLILMSATIDTTLFCKYFGEGFESGSCPYIEVPGRTYPVTSHFLDDIYSELKMTYSKQDAFDLYSRESQDYIDRELINPRKPALLAAVAASTGDGEDDSQKAMIDWKSQGVIGEDGELDLAMDKDDTVTPVGIIGITIAHLLKTTTEGSILVFLPGLQEIVTLEKQLMSTRPLGIDFANNPNYKLHMLHSSLPQMQQEVFSKVGPGQRKIILATNIAETSITIPDVVYVVDSSKHREVQYDRARRISSLISAWTAKSNARQRAGRAGRVQHGHYYTMASKARYDSFEVSPKPEMLRTNLQDLCLQIKSIGIQDIWDFLRRAIEPPSQTTVEIAIDELQALRALDEAENLTPLGRFLSLLPLAPSLGKMVVLAVIFKCLDPMIILAAASTSKDPFLSPPDKREEASRTKGRFAMGTGSDHAALINAFQDWRRLKGSRQRSEQSARQFAYDNFLHHDTLCHIERTAGQILDTLEKSGIIEANNRSESRSMRGSRDLYGTAEENINANSQALQVALATAGFYPNIAVRTRNSLPRFLQTVHENEVEIHPWSLAAPRTESGRRHGRITAKEAARPGTLFTFSQKTQADQQGISLRSVARTYPLAVTLFGGNTSREGSVLTVDEWIPFYARNIVMNPLVKFIRKVDEYLERTFGRLGTMNRRRLLGQSEMDQEEGFLQNDRTGDPLITGVVEVLESCAPREPLNTVHNSQEFARRPDLGFRRASRERRSASDEQPDGRRYQPSSRQASRPLSRQTNQPTNPQPLGIYAEIERRNKELDRVLPLDALFTKPVPRQSFKTSRPEVS